MCTTFRLFIANFMFLFLPSVLEFTHLMPNMLFMHSVILLVFYYSIPCCAKLFYTIAMFIIPHETL